MRLIEETQLEYLEFKVLMKEEFLVYVQITLKLKEQPIVMLRQDHFLSS